MPLLVQVVQVVVAMVLAQVVESPMRFYKLLAFHYLGTKGEVYLRVPGTAMHRTNFRWRIFSTPFGFW